MSRPKPNHSRKEGKKALRCRLVREAEATRPAFSETLHEQICRAVQESRATGPVATSHGSSARRRFRWAAAMAIATSILVAVLVWQTVEERANPGSGATIAKAPVPVETASDTDLDRVAELTGGATESVDAWLDSTLASQRWAYLDHDAQVALEAIADRLPFGFLSDGSSEQPAEQMSSVRALD